MSLRFHGFDSGERGGTIKRFSELGFLELLAMQENNPANDTEYMYCTVAAWFSVQRVQI